MMTTLDLPESLVEEVKVQALRQGEELAEAFAGLVRKGLQLSHSPPPKLEPSLVTTSALGFPIIAGGHPASASEELTPRRVAELLLSQEVFRHDEAARH